MSDKLIIKYGPPNNGRLFVGQSSSAIRMIYPGNANENRKRLLGKKGNAAPVNRLRSPKAIRGKNGAAFIGRISSSGFTMPKDSHLPQEKIGGVNSPVGTGSKESEASTVGAPARRSSTEVRSTKTEQAANRVQPMGGFSLSPPLCLAPLRVKVGSPGSKVIGRIDLRSGTVDAAYTSYFAGNGLAATDAGVNVGAAAAAAMITLRANDGAFPNPAPVFVGANVVGAWRPNRKLGVAARTLKLITRISSFKGTKLGTVPRRYRLSVNR